MYGGDGGGGLWWSTLALSLSLSLYLVLLSHPPRIPFSPPPNVYPAKLLCLVNHSMTGKKAHPLSLSRVTLAERIGSCTCGCV